ncbi:MAG: ABC transporter substrate binding protein [Solidesulfovibrio sp.]
MEFWYDRPNRFERRFLIGAIFCCLLLFGAVRVVAAPPPGILLLSSYHRGDAWSDREVDGFLGAFQSDQAQIFVEHLDSRRSPEESNKPEFLSYIQARYRDVPVALLVAVDDAALDFWLANREKLFPERPLVFCGVNDFTPERIAGHGNITGVGESPNILGTLEMALELLPESHTVVALGSTRDATAKANLARFRRAASALGRRIRPIEIVNVDLKSALAALAASPKNTIVLHLSPLLDAAGLRLPAGMDMPALTNAANMPVFALWDFELGMGSLGGRVVRAESQGRAAAAMAQKILAGVSADDIPVTDSTSEPVLDSLTMKRFALSPAKAPPETIYINEPGSPYERYKLAIWCGAIVLFVSLPAVIILAGVLASRRRVEARLAENERRYRELVENAHSLILRFDAAGRLVFVNEYAKRLLGYSRQELLDGKVSFWPTSPANLPGLLVRAITAPETLGRGDSENEVTTKDGRRVYVRWDNRPLLRDDGQPEGWLAVGADITDRRLAEDALAARILAEEELSGFARDLLADAPGAVNRALRRLLTALGVDRAAWFENFEDPELGLCWRFGGEACSPALSPQADNPRMSRIPFGLDEFLWANGLGNGETISGLAGEFPETQQEVFRYLGVQAVMAAPIVINGVWGGFLAVGETRLPRRFSRLDQTFLVTAANLLAVYLSRPRV